MIKCELRKLGRICFRCQVEDSIMCEQETELCPDCDRLECRCPMNKQQKKAFLLERIDRQTQEWPINPPNESIELLIECKARIKELEAENISQQKREHELAEQLEGEAK